MLFSDYIIYSRCERPNISLYLDSFYINSCSYLFALISSRVLVRTGLKLLLIFEVTISNPPSAMNQEEDEDAFLSGDTSETAGATTKKSSVPVPVDHDMEPASEEGEVDDEEEDDEDDSVAFLYRLGANL